MWPAEMVCCIYLLTLFINVNLRQTVWTRSDCLYDLCLHCLTRRLLEAFQQTTFIVFGALREYCSCVIKTRLSDLDIDWGQHDRNSRTFMTIVWTGLSIIQLVPEFLEHVSGLPGWNLISQLNHDHWGISFTLTVMDQKIRTLFFKMLVIRVINHKMLVWIANREDPDQTASESSLIWVCFVCPCLFGRQLGFKILEHLPYFTPMKDSYHEIRINSTIVI